jgi:cytochrome c556
MRTMTKFAGAVAAAALVVGLGAAGVSAQDKEAVVKDRQATMKSMGAGMGAVKAFIDGNGDQKKAEDGVQQILTAAKTIPDRFPQGTSMEEMKDVSWAKPAIWSEHDKFLAAQKNLVSEVEKLNEAVKSGDKNKVQAQFGETGKNGCGGCHTPFRQSKPS